MNKKVMMLTITLLTVAMLTTPIVGMVTAGKGQEKLDFVLILEDNVPNFGSVEWKESDGILFAKGLSIVASVVTLTVDGVPVATTDYSFISDLVFLKNGGQEVHAEETITFADGILVLSLQDRYVPESGQYIGSFIGFGTGSLEGVKVQGTSVGDGTDFTRTGTVMGWPTA